MTNTATLNTSHKNSIKYAREKKRETETETQIQRQKHKDRDRDKQRQTDRQTDRQTEDDTLLHKYEDLSTSRLFCKSVPDDKHSNTQYIKQEFN